MLNLQLSQEVSHIDRRDRNFDYLKTFSIIGVVCIHIGIPFADLFRFCVPCFIGMWAFYLERGLTRRPKEEYKTYILDRLKMLVIPYMFWTLFYISLYPSTSWFTTPIHTIIGGWMGGYGWSGQYYFIILMQLTLLFPILRKWIQYKNFGIAIAIGIILNIFSEYVLPNNKLITGLNARIFIYWIPYVAIGIVLSRNYLKAKTKYLIVALPLLPMVVIENNYLNGWCSYLGVSVTFLSLALLLALAPTENSSSPKNQSLILRILNKISDCIGRDTFSIFVSNTLLLKIVQSMQNTLSIHVEGVMQVFLWNLIVAILVLSGGLLIGYIFRYLKIGFLIGSK
jgi:hypothetical protein